MAMKPAATSTQPAVAGEATSARAASATRDEAERRVFMEFIDVIPRKHRASRKVTEMWKVTSGVCRVTRRCSALSVALACFLVRPRTYAGSGTRDDECGCRRHATPVAILIGSTA